MPITLKVHVVHLGKVEIHERVVSDTTQGTLQDVHDYFEGQVGMVTAIYDAGGGTRLYKAPYEAFEV